MRLPRLAACFALAVLALVAGAAPPSHASQWFWHDGFDEAAAIREREEDASIDGLVAAFAAMPAAEVVAELESVSWPRRRAASVTLAKRSAEAVPLLVEALGAPAPWRRAGAAATLARIGPAGAVAGPHLATLLRDATPVVRYHAVRALAATDPTRAAEALVLSDDAGLTDRDATVRRAAIESVTAIGASAVAALRKRLTAPPAAEPSPVARDPVRDGSGARRSGAAGRRGSAADGGSPDPAAIAADVLGRIGVAANAAVPDLVSVLRSERLPDVRCAAARALGAIGAADAVPALVERLRARGDGHLTTAAAEALADLGPTAAPVARDIVEVFQLGSLSGEGEEFRGLYSALWRAIEALGAAAAPALGDALVSDAPDTSNSVRFLEDLGDAGIAQLIRGIRPPDGNQRNDAVEALERMGPKAAAAVPELVAALAAEEPWDRLCAAKALTAIDPTRAEILPVLAEALANARPDSIDVETVAEAAGRLGPRGAALVPALRAVTSGAGAPKRDVTAALVALVRIAPEARADVDALLADRKNPVCESAFDAMTSLGPAAAPWVATLLGDPWLDARVQTTLVRWGAPSVEPVVHALDSPRAEVRRSAAKTLARLEGPARAAVLAAALRDDPAVREGLLAGLGECRSAAIDVWLRLFPTAAAQASDAASDAFASACRAFETASGDPADLPTTRQCVDALCVEAPAVWVRGDLWGHWPAAGGPWQGRRHLDAAGLRAAVATVSAAAVPDLVAVLDDADPRRRLVAVGLLDAVARPVRPVLRSAASYGMVDPRRMPVRASDPAAVAAVRDLAGPALRRLARGTDREVARAAAAALAGLGTLAPEDAAPLVGLVVALPENEDPGAQPSLETYLVRFRREAAVEALAAAPAEALAGLVEAIRTGPDAARSNAVRALAELDATPPGVVDALRPHLASEFIGLRVHAARALVRRGGDPENLAPVLAEGLASGAPEVVHSALDGLGRCGPAAAPYVEAIVACLEGRGDRDTRRALLAEAVSALRAAGPAAEPFAARIAAAVRDRRRNEPDVPGLAALLRATIREPALRIPLLLSLTPQDPAVADEVADALAAEGPAVLVALGVALDLHDPPAGSSALLACARLGPAAAPLLDRIAADPWRADALRVRTLAAMGPEVWRMLPRFEERAAATGWRSSTAPPDIYRAAVERILGW